MWDRIEVVTSNNKYVLRGVVDAVRRFYDVGQDSSLQGFSVRSVIGGSIMNTDCLVCLLIPGNLFVPTFCSRKVP